MHNRSILRAIQDTYCLKHLNGSFVKIKSHSGNIGNEIADTQAKFGADSARINIDRIVDLDFGFGGFSNSLNNRVDYNLYWKGNLVDRHVRNFFKNSNIIRNMTGWAMNG